MNGGTGLLGRENYPIVPLEDLCDLCSGITKGRKIDSTVTVKVPYMAVANVQDGSLKLDNVKTIEATPEEIHRYHLMPGDLLLTEGGDPDKLGRGAIWNGEISSCIHQNHIFRARKASQHVDMEYLAHLVSSPYGKRYFLRQSKQTTGIASINMGQLKRFPVPLPPLEVQRRIAAILDKASSIVASQQRRTAILWQLEASLFSQMATDSASYLKDCMLKDLAADGDKINYGVVQPGNQFDGGVPLIRVGDLVSGGVDRSAIKCIDPAIETTYTRSRIVGNEILLSCVGSIGVVALVKPRDIGSNIARAVARVPVSQSVNRKWLAACLRSTTVQRYFINELRTVSQPTLNIKQIEETIIRLPPIELQNSFAIKLDAIEKICKRSSFSEAQMSNLISAFQSKAFMGIP